MAEFKKKLNEHLVGNYRNVREELWVEYNKQPAEERPDLCQFLDCILDDSFIGLEFSQQNLPSTLFNKEGSFYPLQIVETVSKCCPSLQEISFTISTHAFPISAEALWAKSFAGFKKLSKLKIDWFTSSKCIHFFTHIGSSCPNLKVLKPRKLPFQLDKQFALVLGLKAPLVVPFVKERMLQPERDNRLSKIPLDQTQTLLLFLLNKQLFSSSRY